MFHMAALFIEEPLTDESAPRHPPAPSSLPAPGPPPRSPQMDRWSLLGMGPRPRSSACRWLGSARLAGRSLCRGAVPHTRLVIRSSIRWNRTSHLYEVVPRDRTQRSNMWATTVIGVRGDDSVGWNFVQAHAAGYRGRHAAGYRGRGTEDGVEASEWRTIEDQLSTALYVSSVFEVVAPVVTVLARVSGVGSLRWRVKQYSGMAHAQR